MSMWVVHVVPVWGLVGRVCEMCLARGGVGDD